MKALWLALALAWAGPTAEEISQQRLRVAEAATQVADARARGSRRSEVAALMASYRAEAERLALLLAELPPEEAPERALEGLVEALAEGRVEPELRARVEARLGPLEDRLDLLAGALEETGAWQDLALRRSVLHDVVEQAAAVALAAAYDAAVATQEADTLARRAAGLRRTPAGEILAVEDEIRARRLDEEAARARARATLALSIGARAAALRARALALLEETP